MIARVGFGAYLPFRREPSGAALGFFAETGTLALAGLPLALTRSMALAMDAGAIGLTGEAVTITRHLVIAADAGVLALTGQDATFTVGATWLLTGGTWNDEGVWDDSATWSDGPVVISAELGTVALEGQPIDLTRMVPIAAAAGGLALTGQDATITVDSDAVTYGGEAVTYGGDAVTYEAA